MVYVYWLILPNLAHVLEPISESSILICETIIAYPVSKTFALIRGVIFQQAQKRKQDVEAEINRHRSEAGIKYEQLDTVESCSQTRSRYRYFSPCISVSSLMEVVAVSHLKNIFLVRNLTCRLSNG